MTPRPKRYFARKSALKVVIRIMHSAMDFAQPMTDLMKPIPKYPPGTEHPGGPAIVGVRGPELSILPGKGISLPIEFYQPETKGIYAFGPPERPMLINFNPDLSPEQLKKPVEDMTMAFNRQIINSIIKQTTR